MANHTHALQCAIPGSSMSCASILVSCLKLPQCGGHVHSITLHSGEGEFEVVLVHCASWSAH